MTEQRRYATNMKTTDLIEYLISRIESHFDALLFVGETFIEVYHTTTDAEHFRHESFICELGCQHTGIIYVPVEYKQRSHLWNEKVVYDCVYLLSTVQTMGSKGKSTLIYISLCEIFRISTKCIGTENECEDMKRDGQRWKGKLIDKHD